MSAKRDHDDKFADVDVIQDVALGLCNDSNTWFVPDTDVGGEPQVDDELWGLQAGSPVNL